MDKIDFLKEYYDSITGLPPFAEAEKELKEGIYQSWGFKVYCLGRSWNDLKQEIKDSVIKILPKN